MEWDPTSLFRTDTVPTNPFAILVLNQPVNERAFDAVRRHACYTLLADGGANRYYDLAQSRSAASTDLPSCILGDLDSIQSHVRAHYAAHHVPILHDPDQYSTDFAKCMRFLRTHAHAIMSQENPALSDNHDLYMTSRRAGPNLQRKKKLDVVVLGGLGGRVDQGFSQIHHLYMAHAQRREISSRLSSAGDENEDILGELYLLSEESLSFILSPGKHIIHTPLTHRLDLADTSADQDEKNVLAENVGIIPLAGPTFISLTGFEWDVTRWKTEIGGQLSTSNHIRASRLEIEVDMAVDRPVLFTVELVAGLKKGYIKSRSSAS
ncbi:thiamine pyrophosphokinase, putative [Talaromyces islandicus]|uniref:Thiamine pyrophosphokinase n=1 Tax=Talaromyces islandicus TaxID=28573 RepID=A0A0U1M0W3_TALIS|nr:thiamine pyrophosphokinase, putative [Talaromyces islandicus]